MAPSGTPTSAIRPSRGQCFAAGAVEVAATVVGSWANAREVTPTADEKPSRAITGSANLIPNYVVIFPVILNTFLKLQKDRIKRLATSPAESLSHLKSKANC